MWLDDGGSRRDAAQWAKPASHDGVPIDELIQPADISDVIGRVDSIRGFGKRLASHW